MRVCMITLVVNIMYILYYSSARRTNLACKQTNKNLKLKVLQEAPTSVCACVCVYTCINIIPAYV